MFVVAGASRSSRRSSFTSDACSSNVEQTAVSHKILSDIEAQANILGRSVDKMLADLQTNLHNVSELTL